MLNKEHRLKCASVCVLVHCRHIDKHKISHVIDAHVTPSTANKMGWFNWPCVR